MLLFTLLLLVLITDADAATPPLLSCFRQLDAIDMLLQELLFIITRYCYVYYCCYAALLPALLPARTLMPARAITPELFTFLCYKMMARYADYASIDFVSIICCRHTPPPLYLLSPLVLPTDIIQSWRAVVGCHMMPGAMLTILFADVTLPRLQRIDVCHVVTAALPLCRRAAMIFAC